MTDITELAQRMKAAAEKATKGPWVTFDDDWSDDEDVVVTNEARDNDCVPPIAVIKCGGSESDDDSPYCAEQRANAVFIALANPANVRALVEALEKAQQQITQLESRTVTVKMPKLKMLEDYLAEVAIEERKQILVGVKLEFHRECAAAGIKVEAE